MRIIYADLEPMPDMVSGKNPLRLPGGFQN